jgi:ketosteroid isomerase-like protein
MICPSIKSQTQNGATKNMKRIFVWSVVALLSLVVAAQAKDDMGGGTEQAVAGLEQKWIDAAKAGNPDMLAPLLADKFINTAADGKVTGKKETLATVKTAKWEKTEISNVKVTVFGNVAIATGDWAGKGTVDGKPLDTHERWTDTWIKMPGGKWQCVASHGSTVKS